MIALFLCLFLTDLTLFLFMIFCMHKSFSKTLAWTCSFLFLPFFSHILFLLIGIGVLNRKQKLKLILKNGFLNKKNLNNNFKKTQKNIEKYYKNLALFNINLHKTMVLKNNDLQIYRSGKTTFKNIFCEIEKAKNSIFVSSYIFCDDEIGNKMKNLLIKKAQQKVKVVVLFDSVGSKKTSKSFFKSLQKCGIVVCEFFPSKIKHINIFANYRNHRKIIVVDMFTSFVGGINIRDDHLGKNEKLSPWLDTHLKIVGNTSLELLQVIIEDIKLNQNQKLNDCLKEVFDNLYFEKLKSLKLSRSKKKGIDIQVLNSSKLFLSQKIEESLICLINLAKKEIFIETPYLILDNKFFVALKLATIRGVKVNVIISKKPDKKFVYNASLYYAKMLCEIGVNIFLFDGFVHSKTLLCDEKIFVCGSTNFDVRSFDLNFETSVIIYNKNISQNFHKMLKKTLSFCTRVENNFYKKLPVSKKLAINFSKLFSPIL